jgi:MFS family permease
MSIRQWTDVGLIYVLGCAANVALGLLAPLSVDLAAATHATTQQIGPIPAALYLPFLLGGVVVGRIVDKVDSRVLMMASVGAIAAAALLDLKADTIIWWVADICLMSAGLVTLVVTAQTTLARAVSGKAQSAVLSLWATTPYVGLSLGYLLSGALAETANWRWVFLIQASAAVAVAIPAVLLLTPRQAGAAPAGGHHGGGGLGQIPQFFARELKVVRLCLAYGVVTAASAGSGAVWPLYLSRFYETKGSVISQMMAVTTPVSVLGPMLMGVLLARGVSSAKIGVALAAGGIVSTALIYTPHLDLRIVTAAMALWALSISSLMAFSFSLIPRLLSDQAVVGVATGMFYQLSSLCVLPAVPAFFAIAALSNANLIFVGLVSASWLLMIVIAPLWRTPPVPPPAAPAVGANA